MCEDMSGQPTSPPRNSPSLLLQPPHPPAGVSGDLFKSIDKALDERTIGHNPERLCLLKGEERAGEWTRLHGKLDASGSGFIGVGVWGG